MKRITLDSLEIATILKSRPVIGVYDLETTGLKHEQERPIQFSGILLAPVEGGSYKKVTTLDYYINPGFPISKLITDLTGITNEQLATCPSEREVFPKIKEFFEKADVVSGYNILKFDNDFIEDMCYRNGTGSLLKDKPIVDVILPARELISKDDVHTVVDGKDKYHTLENVARYYGCALKGFHNAYVDIINTYRVLFAEMRDLKSEKHSIFANTTEYNITEMTRFNKSKEVDRIFVTLMPPRGESLKVEYDVYNNRFITDGPYSANDVYKKMLEIRDRLNKKSWVSFEGWRAENEYN